MCTVCSIIIIIIIIKTALPGLLDKDDQVRYIMYMLTKDDCSKPDLMFTVYSNMHHTYRNYNSHKTFCAQCNIFTIRQNVIPPPNTVRLKRCTLNNIVLFTIKVCHTDCLSYALYDIMHQYDAKISVQPDRLELPLHQLNLLKDQYSTSSLSLPICGTNTP